MSDERVEIVDWEKQAGIPQSEVSIEPKTLKESAQTVFEWLALQVKEPPTDPSVVAQPFSYERLIELLKETEVDKGKSHLIPLPPEGRITRYSKTLDRLDGTQSAPMRCLSPEAQFKTVEQMACELDSRLRRVEAAFVMFLEKVAVDYKRFGTVCSLTDIASEVLKELKKENDE